MNRSLALFLAGLASVVTAGCGGGGGGGGATSLGNAADFSDADDDTLLVTAEFGKTVESEARIDLIGLPNYVAEITSPQSFGNIMAIEAEAAAATIDDPAFPSEREINEYWLYILQYSNDPFREQMALFWHDHFATSVEVLNGDERYWMIDHISMLRRNAMGNLRTFLIEMAVDWTMLEWLDGVNSRKGNINENFAREFWELFTLGVDNGYTQEDIEEASRVFTGFRKRSNPDTGQNYIEFDEDRHDENDKLIFGMSFVGRDGPDAYFEYADMVDFTLANRPVAEFVCTKLFEFFCYADPPQSVIDSLAANLRANNYELRPVIQQILLSDAFYSDASVGSRIKSPLEFSIGMIRTTGLHIPDNQLRNEVSVLEQVPSEPPGVEGWPNGELWLSTQAMVERSNMVRRIIVERNFQDSNGHDIERIMPPTDQRSADEVVDHFANLFVIDLTTTERQLLIDYLNSDRENNGTVVSSPFDGNSSQQIDEKVRGLVYIMGSHPDFHIR